MKKIQYMALSGAALLLTAFAAVSCDDANDWNTDPSYSRLFSSPKISVSANAIDAEVTFSAVPNAEYYVIEVSKDTLYDEVGMGSSASSIIYGEDKSITKSPVVIENLDSDSKYFLRIKSYAADQKESLWGYMQDFSFKTRTEQIINEWEVSAEKVVISWPANSTVTKLEIQNVNGEVVKSVTLTPEQIAEGSVTIDGLTQLTDYTAVLYNGTAKRGVISFTTPAKVPDADIVKYLQPNDSINTTLFEEIAAAGHKSVTIALPAGSVYYNANSVKLPDGLSVNFLGLIGGEQPVMAVNGINFAGSHEYIKFENINLSAEGKNAEGGNTQLNYLFNQSEAAQVGLIEFSNCFVHGYKNTPFRLQGSAEKPIETLRFLNTIVYGADTRSYSLVHIDASKGKGKVENIEFIRSTIVYTGKCFVYSRNTDFTSLIVRDCTLSKMMGGGDYFLDCDKNGNGPQSITIANTIFGSTSAEAKGIRANDVAPDVTNCYITTDMKITGNKIDGLTEYEGGEADLFKNPALFDFTIIDNNFAGKRNCGDPRWYME